MHQAQLISASAAFGRMLLGAIFVCSAIRLIGLKDGAIAGLVRHGMPAARPLLYVSMGYKVVAGC